MLLWRHLTQKGLANDNYRLAFWSLNQDHAWPRVHAGLQLLEIWKVEDFIRGLRRVKSSGMLGVIAHQSLSLPKNVPRKLLNGAASLTFYCIFLVLHFGIGIAAIRFSYSHE